MALRIKTNMMSLVAQRHLGRSTKKVGIHMEKLSSGRRINKAADDAAGLAIAEALRSDIRSLDQARRNANDGISLIQVAEGSMGEITGMLIRLRELSIQAASDTIGKRERSYLNMEFMALKDEISRIATSTEFNGTRLLTGKSELPEELQNTGNSFPLEVQVDKEYYPETDALTSPNPLNIIRLNFQDMNMRLEGEGSLELGKSDPKTGVRIDSKEGAQSSLNRLDDAMSKVNRYRSTLGAMQNRLQASDRNLQVRVEALAMARSRIYDADFAQESAELTQANILQQAGTAVLAQANQTPQLALQLLQN